ncbi:MAG: bacillithiol biosynthesis cysteine-adding enzyme BshC [Vicinamibacterales bacterium]
MTTGTAAPDVTRTFLDIRSLPSTSALARDYAFAFERVAPFYAGDPADTAAWRAAIRATLAHPAHADAPRGAMAAVIRAQQARRHAPAAATDALERLARAGTVAVVTGQQAGLFGGPVYTLFKAVSAIALAARVEADTGTPAVPVFWADGEDHDWEEVRHCTVLAADDATVALDAPHLPGAGTRPVGALVFDDAIRDTLAALERSLPPSPFTADLLALLSRAYAPGAGMTRAFATLVEQVLGPRGLVVFESNDPAAKPLVAELFAAEVASAPRSAALALGAGETLQALGYHAQLQPAVDAAGLFDLRDARTPIRVDGGTCRIGAALEDRHALAARVRQAPDGVGPSVLLRPLVQDTLFPTVCYVAGPSELAYFAQLKPVYAAHGIPMPLVQARTSGTILDGNASRFLGRSDVPFEALAARDERALNALLAAQMPAAVDAAGQAALDAVSRSMDTLAAAVTAVDATLEGAVKSAASRMQDDLKKLQGKILQAAKKKDDTLRRQFRHAQVQAFPDGAPQERQIGWISLMNRVGPGLVDRILSDMPPSPGRHWIVTL